MKRFIISLLVFMAVMLCSSSSFASELKETNVDETELLYALGIIKQSEHQDDSVSRAQFAEIAVRLNNAGIVSGSKASVFYDDVSDESPYAHYIATAYELELMTGCGGNHFEPDREMKLEDALSVYSKICGYSKSFVNESVYKTAESAGLLKGITLTETLSFENMIKITLNCLNAAVVEPVSVGKNGTEYKKSSDTLLKERFNAEKSEETVNVNFFSSMSGEESVEPGKVKIGETIYLVGETDAEKYLGLRCKFYYTWDSEKSMEKLLYITPIGNCKILTVSAEDVQNYSLNVLTYTDNNKSRSARVGKSADIMYNGQHCANYFAELFKPKHGEITLIDKNGDGEYDAVFIYEYQNYFVSYINNAENQIVDSTGKAFQIVSLGDDDLKDFLIYNGDKRIGIADIPLNSVASVFIGQNGFNLVYISTNSFSGMINAYSNDDKTVTVGQKEYKAYDTSPFIEKRGKYALVYLDCMGVAFYAETDSSEDSRTFAYLIKLKQNNDISKKVELLILDCDGEVKTVLCDDKIFLNDKKTDLLTESYTELWDSDKNNEDNMKVIEYEMNDNGKIRKIFTALSDGDNVDENRLRLSYPRGNEMEFIYTTRVFIEGTDTTSPKPVNINESTLIFVVPYDTDDIDSYFVTDQSRFRAGEKLAFDGYRISKSKLVNIMVIKGNEIRNTDGYRNSILITKIYNTTDENGYDAYRIDGCINRTVSKSLYTKGDDSLVEEQVKKLAKGDYIIYGLNQMGKIDIIERMYNSTEMKSEMNESTYNHARCVFGIAESYLDGIVTVKSDSGTEFSYKYDGKVFIYNKAENTVTEGSVSDIVPGANILLRIYNEYVNDAVIMQ